MRRVPQFTDAQGVLIEHYSWPVPAPRAVVQLSHGVGEYAERYLPLVAALNEAGYSVCADDHRGHGRTGLAQWHGDVAKLGRLGPGGLRAAVDDIRRVSAIAREQNPDRPLVMLGHSWGSLMAQTIVNGHPGDYDGLVLTGTAYRMPGSMAAGDLNRRFRRLGSTGHEWLSRDPGVARDFAADRLTFDADVLKLFGLADALRLFGRPRAHDLSSLPILVMIGSEDPLGGPASVQRLERSFRRRARVTDYTTVVYPGARHEVFNETNRAEVFADLVAWLDRRFPERQAL